jgi:hypothetical protein
VKLVAENDCGCRSNRKRIGVICNSNGLCETKIYSVLNEMEVLFAMSLPSCKNGASMRTWTTIERTIDEDTTPRNMFVCKQEISLKSEA